MKTGTSVHPRHPYPRGPQAMSASDDRQPATYRYRLAARRSAGVAPRVIEAFAKRALVPERFECRAAGDRLAIEVEVALDDATARHIARCLANVVEVERVALTEATAARAAGARA